VDGRPCKAPRALEIIWNPPLDWLKVNTDGATFGGPDLIGCDDVFHTCRGFIEGCFAIPFGVCFSFEAELVVVVCRLSMSSLLVEGGLGWRATQLTWWL